MKTYLIQEGDEPFAFEIDHVYLSLSKIVRLLRTVDGTSEVRIVGHFGGSNPNRVEFKCGGSEYIVMEPFGDNSRYWVGPKEGKDDKPAAKNIGKIKGAFDAYRAPLPAKILGDLLSLNFKALFSRQE
jgi:hypothetical protein